MTLFTKRNCQRCDQLKESFDLAAMDVKVEVLDADSAAALAHLAWHSLVETARKTLPILVLDDSSSIADFASIEQRLATRAGLYGLRSSRRAGRSTKCAGSGCAIN